MLQNRCRVNKFLETGLRNWREFHAKLTFLRQVVQITPSAKKCANCAKLYKVCHLGSRLPDFLFYLFLGMRVFENKCFCGHAGFEFPFSILDRGEGCAEVERILALLMESRVGPGFTYEYLPPIFSFPIEANVNYDLMPSWSLAVRPEAMFADPPAASDVNRMCVTKEAPLFRSYDRSHLPPQALARGSPPGTLAT
jgi:hypothetical protein